MKDLIARWEAFLRLERLNSASDLFKARTVYVTGLAFLEEVLGRHVAHSTAGALHFVCMDWRHVGELLAAGSAVYSELKNCCVWVKTNAGMGSLYRSQHELVFVFKAIFFSV